MRAQNCELQIANCELGIARFAIRDSQFATRRGFTVIELTLVLTVLVVAAAVVLPGFPAFARGQRLRSAAGRLAGLVRYAMQWSREHTREVVLSYDEEERRFSLDVAEEPAEQVLADPAPAEEMAEELPHLDEGQAALQLPADVELDRAEVAGEEQAPPLSVRFLADGRCGPSATDAAAAAPWSRYGDTVIVLRAREARCTLRLEGRRGRVMVEAGDGE